MKKKLSCALPLALSVAMLASPVSALASETAAASEASSEIKEPLAETGIVGDGEGWELWDEEGNLSLEGRDAVGENAVVSSGKYEASKAGMDILEMGGNGVDAAIAVSFALGVVEPNSSGIGGGGFMTIRGEDGTVKFLDFRERAPGASTPEMWQLDEEGKVIGGQSSLGGKSIGIPGVVAGMWEAYNTYGSGEVEWADLIQPAITLAEEGFYVTPTLANDMSNTYNYMLDYAEFGKVYLNDGLNYQIGDLFKNPDLGRTLRVIAEEGKDGFYTGTIAERMVATSNKYGAVFTMDDLANYEVFSYEPVYGTYRGYQIYSSPTPSSGGVHLVQILNIMENFDISELGANTAETLHIMSEAFKMAFIDRTEYMGDPNYVEVPLTGLVSKEYAKEQANQIKTDGVIEYTPVDPWEYESEDTTHYSVADAAGNMVAVTQTVNGIFGSKVIVDGFVMNNEMDDFAKTADSPNAIAPWKTPLSSMSPTIVLTEEGEPFMVLGSPGATRIFPTCVQVISNVIDHGMDMQEALNAPRIYNNATSALDYEERIDAEVIEALQALGHEVTANGTYNRSFGSVNAILYGEDGKLYGGADVRRDGKSLAN